MKKMFLGLSLAVAALGFLMSPAMAAGAPVLSVSDQAFLASLAVPAATPAAKRPQIGAKSLCSATANCWNGGTVSCSGNSSTTSCSAVDGSCPERGHVTCDGVTTVCPTPCPGCDPNFCDNAEADCAAQCDPCSYTLTCSEVTCTSHCHCNFRTCLQ